MQYNYFYPIINTVGFILVIIINALANILPIAGNTTGEVSARYTNLFVPAGYAFSIWAVIYLLLGNFIIFGWFQGLNYQAYTNIGLVFVISCLLNIVWLFLWHNNRIWFSTIIMLGLLVSLIKIYEPVQEHSTNLDGWSFVSLSVTFSVYLGWISVAIVANISAALTSSNWNGFGLAEELWFIVVIIVITLLSIFIIIQFTDFYFISVIIWALVAILIKYPDNEFVKYSIIGSLIIIILTSILQQIEFIEVIQ